MQNIIPIGKYEIAVRYPHPLSDSEEVFVKVIDSSENNTLWSFSLRPSEIQGEDGQKNLVPIYKMVFTLLRVDNRVELSDFLTAMYREAKETPLYLLEIDGDKLVMSPEPHPIPLQSPETLSKLNNLGFKGHHLPF